MKNYGIGDALFLGNSPKRIPELTKVKVKTDIEVINLNTKIKKLYNKVIGYLVTKNKKERKE